MLLNKDLEQYYKLNDKNILYIYTPNIYIIMNYLKLKLINKMFIYYFIFDKNIIIYYIK